MEKVLPAFSVIGRGLSELLLEEAVEVGSVGKAQVLNDRRDALVRMQQQIFGFVQIDGLSVGQKGLAGIFFHDMLF